MISRGLIFTCTKEQLTPSNVSRGHSNDVYRKGHVKRADWREDLLASRN